MKRDPDKGDDTGTPRWVKAFGIITIVLLLGFAILHLAGRGLGDHGHMGGSDPAPGHGGH